MLESALSTKHRAVWPPPHANEYLISIQRAHLRVLNALRWS
jgi:hypothetical protein